MAGEQLLLDPTGEASGTQLDITDSALGYFLISHDYPDPEPETVDAGSIDTEGTLPAAGKHRPRTITAVIRCVQPAGGTPSIGTMVSNLQRKIGKLFREGGTYRRVLPSGDTLTFDVLRFGARINVPADKRWVARGAADVTLTFTCAPYGRGAATAITINPSTATAKQPHIFTATGLKGDVEGVGHLVVANATNAKTVLYWGLESRYYSAAAEAALFYEAEDCSIGTGAAHAGPSGASGGGASKVVRASSIGTSSSQIVQVTTGGSSLAHTGAYRVLVRLQLSAANAGTVSVRASWLPYSVGSQVFGDWVPVVDSIGVPVEGQWVVLDLGLIANPKATLGSQRWQVLVDAKSTVGADQIDLDWVALCPVNESYGRALAYTGGGFLSADSIDIGDSGVQHLQAGLGTYRGTKYEGDYLRVPPAGAEARTLRVFYLLAGDGGSNLTDVLADATDLDATTATLTYTPRYLSVPAP